jgi:hypothetical protein
VGGFALDGQVDFMNSQHRSNSRPMIHIGTSGWNYPTGKGTWNGVFYPLRRPRGFAIFTKRPP